MSQLLQLTACEIKLQLRSKTFWLIGVLTVAVATFSTFDVLLIQYMVISAITRDKRLGFANILSSLPYGTALLFLARALAVFFLLLGMWPFMAIVVGVLAETEPVDWLFNGKQLAFLTLKYITTCASAVGLVFFAGMVTRYSLWLYLILGVWWIVGLGIVSNLTYFPARTTFFVLGQVVMLPDSPSAAVGYFPEQGLLLGLAAFQIVMAILFLLFAAVRQMIKRGEPVRQLKLLASLILIAVTAGVMAGSSVWQELDNRESGFRFGLQEAARMETVVAKAGVATVDPELEWYYLNVKLRTASHILEGTANLKLRLVDRSSDIIFFTLRNCFAVQEVAIAGRGERLEWWRDGSRLAVQVPADYRLGASLELAISYSGQVWEWFAGRLARPTGPVNFIASPFSLLRSGYAWYPIPGEHFLYTRKYYLNPWDGSQETTLWAKHAIHSPVPFELKVDIDTDNAVVSNLEQTGMESLTGEYKKRYYFGSHQGRDVFLLAGPYQYERKNFPGREEFVEVYSYHQHQSKIDKALNSLAEPYLFYEDMLQSDASFNRGVAQSAKMYTLVEMPPFFSFITDGGPTPNLTLTDTVLISDDIQANKRDIAVLQRWWPENMTVGTWLRNGNITEGLMLYLHTLYKEKTHDPAFYQQVRQKLLTGKEVDSGEKEFILPSLPGGPVVRDVFLTLDIVRTSELGDLAIKQITRKLYQIYTRQGSIHAADFAEAVEMVLSQTDWPQEKATEIRQRLESIAKQVNDPETWKMKSYFALNLFFL